MLVVLAQPPAETGGFVEECEKERSKTDMENVSAPPRDLLGYAE